MRGRGWLRGRSRGGWCAGGIRWRTHDDDRLHQCRGVKVLSIDQWHLPDRLQDRRCDHFSRKTGGCQNVGGHLIPLRDDGHRCDYRCQTGEGSVLTDDVSYTFCGRSILHHRRSRRRGHLARRRLEGDTGVAQGQS